MAAFIEQGLKAAQGAVLDVRAQAGLHLEPDSVSRRVRARVRGRLKAIETIVRRLIILMAAALDLPPLRSPPRARRLPTRWRMLRTLLGPVMDQSIAST
ncbi:hypothetical protein L53_09445 [Hyphomonas sp. L-53-1-40]|uniref:hypothetical protein n=1 Tax=Hyphomonas sp. L-53-1-40 TaxID=1207058 RepID=UPI0004589B56|nr:hypothetical protein [Hyphomonas sp. L-53-1-40]KCZ63484.1 hypothetical protein L53_09445 [Hyphomonas sp. L-53-1-40]